MNTISTAEIAESAARRLKAAVDALGTPLTRTNYGAVAEAADIHQSELSSLVSGKRVLSRHYARKLAPVLGVSEEYLLGLDDLDGAS